jgi:hypothetical protein
MDIVEFRRIAKYYAHYDHEVQPLLSCKEASYSNASYHMYYLLGNLAVIIKIDSSTHLIDIRADRYILHHNFETIEVYEKNINLQCKLLHVCQMVDNYIIMDNIHHHCVRHTSTQSNANYITVVNLFYQSHLYRMITNMNLQKLLQLIEQWTDILFHTIKYLLNNTSKDHFAEFLKLDTSFIRNATLILASLNKDAMITAHISDNILHIRVPDKYQLTIKCSDSRISDIMILIKNERMYFHYHEDRILFSDGVNKIKSSW